MRSRSMQRSEVRGEDHDAQGNDAIECECCECKECKYLVELRVSQLLAALRCFATLARWAAAPRRERSLARTLTSLGHRRVIDRQGTAS